jgi:hypothetical protein
MLAHVCLLSLSGAIKFGIVLEHFQRRAADGDRVHQPSKIGFVFQTREYLWRPFRRQDVARSGQLEARERLALWRTESLYRIDLKQMSSGEVAGVVEFGWRIFPPGMLRKMRCVVSGSFVAASTLPRCRPARGFFLTGAGLMATGEPQHVWLMSVSEATIFFGCVAIIAAMLVLLTRSL